MNHRPIVFFSIVQTPSDKQRNTLTERPRVRGDLAAPEFSSLVLNALQTRKKKGVAIRWEQWGDVLGINPED